MKRLVIYAICLVALSCSTNPRQTASHKHINTWTTTGDRKMLLTQSELHTAEIAADSQRLIALDTSQTFQTIDGFGYALTGGSAMLINTLPAPTRDSLLRELFTTDGNNAGISYLRVSIGGSDLDDEPFTYLDLPKGKTDVALKNFTIDADRKHLIPTLKSILKLSPGLKIMGSPWTAPPWMKTNGAYKDGSLKPEYYDAYARYFVRYIEEMKKEGIRIDAVTLQNEPENPNNTPSMLMTAEEQARFVKNSLGPAFQAAGIDTKIVVFDHNCDHPEYPIAVLNDPDAKKFIDGSAFHMYLGEIRAMTKVHDAHPDKNVYFTEQWTSGEGQFGGDLNWHVKNLIIGATRNWARNVLEWNLAADQNFNPHTDDGGCTLCQGALTIGDSITRNVSYYIIAHASKFVRPGSVRVATNLPDGLPNVGFVTPDGKRVLIVLNDGQEESFYVREGETTFKASLPRGAVGTYVWSE
jgi:glucosylceramidase